MCVCVCVCGRGVRGLEGARGLARLAQPKKKKRIRNLRHRAFEYLTIARLSISRCDSRRLQGLGIDTAVQEAMSGKEDLDLPVFKGEVYQLQCFKMAEYTVKYNTNYDDADAEHEASLVRLWDNVFPSGPLVLLLAKGGGGYVVTPAAWS